MTEYEHNPEPERRDYEVVVSNFFEATSHEDAVRQMVEWLADYAHAAVYGVRAEYEDDWRNVDTELMGR